MTPNPEFPLITELLIDAAIFTEPPLNPSRSKPPAGPFPETVLLVSVKLYPQQRTPPAPNASRLALPAIVLPVITRSVAKRLATPPPRLAVLLLIWELLIVVVPLSRPIPPPKPLAELPVIVLFEMLRFAR